MAQPIIAVTAGIMRFTSWYSGSRSVVFLSFEIFKVNLSANGPAQKYTITAEKIPVMTCKPLSSNGILVWS